MNKYTERLYNGILERKSYLRSDVRSVSYTGCYYICYERSWYGTFFYRGTDRSKLYYFINEKHHSGKSTSSRRDRNRSFSGNHRRHADGRHLHQIFTAHWVSTFL